MTAAVQPQRTIIHEITFPPRRKTPTRVPRAAKHEPVELSAEAPRPSWGNVVRTKFAEIFPGTRSPVSPRPFESAEAALDRAETLIVQEMRRHPRSWGGVHVVDAISLVRNCVNVSEPPVDLTPMLEMFRGKGVPMGAVARSMVDIHRALTAGGVAVAPLSDVIRREDVAARQLEARPPTQVAAGTHAEEPRAVWVLAIGIVLLLLLAGLAVI